MIELLVLVAGIVLLWKMSGALTSASKAMEEATKGWSEDVIADTTLERQERAEEFREELAKYKEKNPNFKLVTHDQFMREMGIHK